MSSENKNLASSSVNEDSVLNLKDLKVRVIDSLAELKAEIWDQCLGLSGSPFLRHSFLRGLEVTACVGGQSGWYPKYVLVEHEDQLVGASPAYIKTHSQGEFIFDWSWADAAHQMGLPYYPKLVVSSPFSPVGSEKLLCDPRLSIAHRNNIRKTLLKGLRQVCTEERLSGLHLLFVSDEELELLGEQGLLKRHTLQFQWENENYQNFEDFLARFRSKKRNQIKRERRRVNESGVEVKAYCGAEIKEEHISLIYKFYQNTVEKYYFGNLYLNQDFFRYLYEHQREDLCILLAEQNNQVIGGSFNLASDGVLYGRYWGIDQDIEIDHLHFEVCSYRGIELCIEKGWRRFEAGAGGGSHKYGRGFLPKVIYSAHEVYLPGFNHALSELLNRERQSLAKELLEIQGEVLKLKND
ncbi:MAG: GNAT family N-acetyltransferase [Myxococcales bacterium]|nr:GNAT family N-acetyltransferase [Myxococcales bacterium]